MIARLIKSSFAAMLATIALGGLIDGRAFGQGAMIHDVTRRVNHSVSSDGEYAPGDAIEVWGNVYFFNTSETPSHFWYSMELTTGSSTLDSEYWIFELGPCETADPDFDWGATMNNVAPDLCIYVNAGNTDEVDPEACVDAPVWTLDSDGPFEFWSPIA